ncbi:MAG: C4-dicarboxylate ABC transporter [Gemmatimonadales bacterium]|nr:C4-dicarboxylate ABC transporter [Gemmatimonadales bacterium]NIN13198.1 C4-dicarboxylate ABC transporter [Gemmatimonadales bacterium]NIN51476.1 C4-dicarboxylate ABC transporter [Gemmatimonadales bacterium]NIP08940.1 C4-dicarboxylate ABC transporter [Gemmatimonadales bacterium]NIR03728.1 C4-dicarboxylate ABC transporter [Gemmatimonadales bacterium]
MFTYAGIVLGVMVAVYIAAKFLRLSTELGMLAAALGGGLVGGFGLPARHIAEGAMTYLDIILIFITATLFMNILKESGGIAFVVRGILVRFHRSRALLMVLLTVLLLLPGALTGAGSVTVLITGGMVAIVLETMGISKVRTAAIVFIVAGLSAAAPPVSLWAMMTAAGVNMPYIGFFLPLLVPCVVASLIAIFLLGWSREQIDLETALKELPRAPEGMSWLKVILPFVVFVLLVAIGRRWPHSTPVIGLPLMFLCAAGTSFVLSPLRLEFLQISRETIAQLLPLIGTLTCVGVLVQIMTLTGVRGLLAVTAVTLPVTLVFATLFFVLPVSEAVLMWGAAPVLGVPLVLLFNTMGLNPIVALAGMSVIWPLGDSLPPTAIIGRLTVEVVGYRDSYGRFLKSCALPAVVIMIIGTLMVVFSSRLSFLTGL